MRRNNPEGDRWWVSTRLQKISMTSINLSAGGCVNVESKKEEEKVISHVTENLTLKITKEKYDRTQTRKSALPYFGKPRRYTILNNNQILIIIHHDA